ncbi:MAG TPA: hypothetical protein VK919_03555, partial [Solirubrobacterales bacterium]|nr:hypothetical protein [Solirubrobacterales bacterium]
KPLREVVAVDDVRRLAVDLGRLLDELPIELGASHSGSTKRGGLRSLRTQAARHERLERDIGAMSTAQRLRLAGALHLLSPRLDDVLAHPDAGATAHVA